jgi:hypothetical protein
MMLWLMLISKAVVWPRGQLANLAKVAASLGHKHSEIDCDLPQDPGKLRRRVEFGCNSSLVKWWLTGPGYNCNATNLSSLAVCEQGLWQFQWCFALFKMAKDKEKKISCRAFGHGKVVLHYVMVDADFEDCLVAESGHLANLAKASWLSWYSQLDSLTHLLKVVGEVVYCMKGGTFATGKVRTAQHEACKVVGVETIPPGSTGRSNQHAQGIATGTG